MLTCEMLEKLTNRPNAKFRREGWKDGVYIHRPGHFLMTSEGNQYTIGSGMEFVEGWLDVTYAYPERVTWEEALIKLSEYGRTIQCKLDGRTYQIHGQQMDLTDEKTGEPIPIGCFSDGEWFTF